MGQYSAMLYGFYLRDAACWKETVWLRSRILPAPYFITTTTTTTTTNNNNNNYNYYYYYYYYYYYFVTLVTMII
jgi:hypothetical protein